MMKQERRTFFHQLFVEGRFIPKIEVLAKASDICVVCSVSFAVHPRNYHLTNEQISANHICTECGVALSVKVKEQGAAITMSNLEYEPCQLCFRGIPASHFPTTESYSFAM